MLDPEISRAIKVLEQYEQAVKAGKGAYGLEGDEGRTEMIDAPMILQAKQTLKKAKQFGLA